VIIEKPGAPQTFLLLGMPGIARSSPDFAAVQVALRVLGGGSSSRLFRNLREKEGYTYGISAREEARRLGGASIVGGSVRADATGRALKAILAEVESMRRDPVPPGELEDAKKSIVLSLPSDFSTAAGIAGMLAEEVIAGLPDDYWTRYASEVMAVTPAEVQRVSQRILDPSRLVTVMVGDAPAVKPQLADLPLGPLEVRPSPATAQPGSPRR
jgi:predicted Zn-dependent peptidase